MSCSWAKHFSLAMLLFSTDELSEKPDIMVRRWGEGQSAMVWDPIKGGLGPFPCMLTLTSHLINSLSFSFSARYKQHND